MMDATSILKRWEIADTYRQANAGVWRQIAQHADPLKRNLGFDGPKSMLLEISGAANVFDSTMQNAGTVYGAGVMSWMTPSGSKWFAYDAPFSLRRDEAVKKWYSECTDIAHELLSGTNFYNEVHNVWIDDGHYGTTVLMIEEDAEKGARFEALPVGSYAVLENQFGEVDTLFRIHRLSARNAAEKFGADKLPAKVRKKLGDSSKQDDEDEYLHYISPRDERDPGKIDAENMPWASVWLFKEEKLVVRESGFIHRPFVCHRYKKWTQTPYGHSPGMTALFDARQLNLMQQYLDTLVEKTVTPPVVVPARYDGIIDLGAGGISYEYEKGDLRHWQNPGNYMVGEDRTVFRASQINRAYHVDLFQTLAGVPVGKQMTAAEVFQRQQDQLPLFHPTFARKNHEMVEPVIQAWFGILLGAGVFPPAPDVLMVGQTPTGGPVIPRPSIVYTSRIAMRFRSLNNEAFGRTFEMLAPLVLTVPSILDNFNFDESARGIARNLGYPEDWLVTVNERDAKRQQAAADEARVMAEAGALEEAEVASKFQR